MSCQWHLPSSYSINAMPSPSARSRPLISFMLNRMKLPFSVPSSPSRTSSWITPSCLLPAESIALKHLSFGGFYYSLSTVVSSWNKKGSLLDTLRDLACQSTSPKCSFPRVVSQTYLAIALPLNQFFSFGSASLSSLSTQSLQFLLIST